MLRWAFAIYMVLVTAAGPNLCCCSLTHLFAGHAEETPASPPAPACCHSETGCGEDAEHQGLGGGCPGEKKDRPHRPGCPCREDAVRPALVDRPVEMPEQFQAASYLPVATPAAFLDFLPGANGVAALPGDPPPFLTADDLLRVHHQLRC